MNTNNFILFLHKYIRIVNYQYEIHMNTYNLIRIVHKYIQIIKY